MAWDLGKKINNYLNRYIFYFISISLFIATNICETIVWKAFSPATINTGRGENGIFSFDFF